MFLPVSQCKKADKKQNSRGEIHSVSQSEVQMLQLLAINPASLVGEPSQSYSPDSSGRRVLCDRDHPEIPRLHSIDIHRYISGEFVGPIHCSHAGQTPQDGNVSQSSSGVLATAHARFIALVG